MTAPQAKPEVAASSKPAEASKTALTASLFDAIVVGSQVLAQVDKAEGFFPARVEKVSADGKTLTLAWIDYPKLPAFTMRRLAVGLLAAVK